MRDQFIRIQNPVASEKRQSAPTHQKRSSAPNYVRYVHDSGVRDGSDVLVVGQVCDEALAALAKRVGKRGSITIVDSDPDALAAIDAKAGDATYTAFQAICNMHPAFDMRPISALYQPVPINTQLIESPELPFSDDSFPVVWIVSLPDCVQGEKHHQFTDELNRVAQNRGRVVTLMVDEQTSSVSMLIDYK